MVSPFAEALLDFAHILINLTNYIYTYSRDSEGDGHHGYFINQVYLLI